MFIFAYLYALGVQKQTSSEAAKKATVTRRPAARLREMA
jgi:hypothetical protein